MSRFVLNIMRQRLGKKTSILAILMLGIISLSISLLLRYTTRFNAVEQLEPTCSAQFSATSRLHRPNISSSAWFISYGDHVFANAKRRIAVQAAETGVFDVIRMFDRDAFVAWADGVGIPTNYTRAKRGGGYWLWKPWAVRNALSDMAEGDMLVYADAGCHVLRPGSQRWFDYFEMVRYNPFSVIAFSLPPYIEIFWTTEAILSYLNANEYVRYSPHYMSTVLVMRKCKTTEELVDAWLNVAVMRPDLFSDDHNVASHTNACFKDNRHDQSVFSVLRKTLPYSRCVIQLRDESYGNIATYTPIIAARDEN